MTELTEAEIEALVWEFGDHTNIATLVDMVAGILDARLAPIRALADEDAALREEHHLMSDCGCSYKDCYECGKWCRCVHTPWTSIRAALSAHESAPQAGDGAGSHEDGERACERCGKPGLHYWSHGQLVSDHPIPWTGTGSGAVPPHAPRQHTLCHDHALQVVGFAKIDPEETR